MSIYYAVCDANGPISRKIETDSEPGVQSQIDAFGRDWIDSASVDAEDDFGFCGDGFSASQMSDAMEAKGLIFRWSHAGWDIYSR